MKNQMTGPALGLVLGLLLIGALAAPAPTATLAQTMPSPRPPLSATADALPAEAQAITLGGRVTGTVIDLSTGVPRAGMRVMIGDTTVETDQNGNYDRAGLPAGNYTVTLVLTPEQGTPAQEPATVAVTDGTVIMHLTFNPPAPAVQPAATPAPTAAAVAPQPAPAAPTRLPNTSGLSDWLWGLGGAAAGWAAVKALRKGRGRRIRA